MRRMLIILDDAWRIEDALALKVGGPNCAYLVTTRFPEVALYFTDDGATVVHELTETGWCLACWLDWHRRLFPRSGVRHETGGIGGWITTRPHIMGKYLQVQGFSGQPRRIQSAITALTALERSPGTERAWEHRSLLAVIETSVQALDEQREMYCMPSRSFSAKPSSFSEEAALAVCNVSPEVLDDLTNAGLLEGSGPGRYTLHQTITDYARTKRSDMEAEVRMVPYFAKFVDGKRADFAVLEQESSNVVEALRIAFDRQLLPSLIKLPIVSRISCAIAVCIPWRRST